MLYCLYCLNTCKMKCIGATPTFFSSAFVWSRLTTPSISRLRESALRDETKHRLRKWLRQQRESDYSNREKIKIIRLQLVTSKIKFRLILLRKANRNFFVPLIDPNQRYFAISNKWRHTEQEERMIFQRGLLDWLLPFWTLPSVCKISNKMQVVLHGINTQLG